MSRLSTILILVMSKKSLSIKEGKLVPANITVELILQAGILRVRGIRVTKLKDQVVEMLRRQSKQIFKLIKVNSGES